MWPFKRRTQETAEPLESSPPQVEPPQEPDVTESSRIDGLEARLFALEKKAEATRRKVYRDSESEPEREAEAAVEPQPLYPSPYGRR